MTLTRNFVATLKLRSYFSFPPAYHLTYQPLQPPPPTGRVRRHFTLRTSSSTHLALFLLLSSRFLPLYRVANFTVSARVDQRNSATRSFISFKKIFPYFNEKSFFSVGQSLLLDSYNILPPPSVTSSFFGNPLLNSAYFPPYPIYKYHLDFVPPFPVLGTKWRENLRDDDDIF